MIEQLQALIRQLVSGIQQVIASGERLSDQFQGAIARTLANALGQLDELEGGEKEEPEGDIEELPTEPIKTPSIPTGGPVPPLSASMPSSNVHSFSYDEKSGKLFVKFQGEYPKSNGPIYAYSGIPQNIFSLFQKGAIPARTNGQNKWGKWWKGKVPSVGASLYTLIKEQGYPYTKVS